MSRSPFARRPAAFAAGLAAVLLSGLAGSAPAAPPSTAPAQPAGAPAPAKRYNVLFCIADDWSGHHAGAYGDALARTPTFDRLAKEGVLFRRAYCASPSCTPSRGAILTGQAIHRLGQLANLWSRWPAVAEQPKTWTDLLAASGYVVGLRGKGWGPGEFKTGGRTVSPAGPAAKDFETFLKSAEGKPFAFWFGSSDPHRPYEKGTGVKAGYDPGKVVVPPFLPDTPEVRSDICDYLFEVERFDRDVGALLDLLEKSGRAADTVVVVTSDNGMPFPRCKANLHDSGTRMPLVIRWPGKVVGPGRATDAFAGLADLAPTFLEAGGLPVPAEMTGRSLVPVLTDPDADAVKLGRDHVFVERERHANVRKGDLSYPARAIRTGDWMYIRNLRPDRWPAGDPETWHSVGTFGDIDGGPSKDEVLRLRDASDADRARFALCCGRRPAEELYDCRSDPWQVRNLADDPAHAKVKAELRAKLDKWMADTGDPRVGPEGGDDRFDKYDYTGGAVPGAPSGGKAATKKGARPGGADR